MMRRNPVKTLEASELVLARMREQRARLEAEIASLEQRHEADVQQFVMNAVKRLNLTQVPAATLLAGLEQLARADRPAFDRGAVSADADSSSDPRQELVEVFVRLSRNASAVNRQILAREGLHWNGRAAGWNGRVTREALQRLREAFPGRVISPELDSSADHKEDEAAPAVEADAPPITSPDVPPASVEPEAVALSEDHASAQTVAEETAIASAQPAVSAATRLLTSPYRPQLPRRPSVT
ncbi:hypothetical protein [Bradyrhizobium sp. CCGE-LA001]|uniref:hypothetical protein n=1 Tax=Bradyrhizobium sp. CCGE-LA001 TaxID=1223566 RepID=UPI000745DA97|nr:hypothetical protein [Bradyrhizobium sp. CCGE-LA001]AMA56888.1 hypothetical protein BCCGELA001_11960 [Bradyrhizobium sp. CCGE-LA001]